MEKSLDELIEFLLGEIALGGARGECTFSSKYLPGIQAQISRVLDFARLLTSLLKTLTPSGPIRGAYF